MASEPARQGMLEADLELENMLLRKQLACIARQAAEVREECAALKARVDTLARETSRDVFPLADFLPAVDGTPSRVLSESMRFYETHDGCPFFEDGCCNREPVRCGGVWIRMGHPCWQLVARVKEIARAVSR